MAVWWDLSETTSKSPKQTKFLSYYHQSGILIWSKVFLCFCFSYMDYTGIELIHLARKFSWIAGSKCASFCSPSNILWRLRQSVSSFLLKLPFSKLFHSFLIIISHLHERSWHAYPKLPQFFHYTSEIYESKREHLFHVLLGVIRFLSYFSWVSFQVIYLMMRNAF